MITSIVCVDIVYKLTNDQSFLQFENNSIAYTGYNRDICQSTNTSTYCQILAIGYTEFCLTHSVVVLELFEEIVNCLVADNVNCLCQYCL